MLLINPPAEEPVVREGRCQGSMENTLPGVSKDWIEFGIPQISLAYVAAILEKDDFNVKIFDCIAEKISLERLIFLSKKTKPSLLILNTSTNTFNSDLLTAKYIKKSFPKSVIALIGAHVTAVHQKLMTSRDFDLVIRGEPEITSLMLANKIRESKSISNIPGTTFYSLKGIKINKPRPFVKNLSDLPWPARHLLPNDKYRDPFFRKNHTLVQVSRGCPYRCIFCVAPIYYGHEFRTREIGDVLNELEYDVFKKHKISSFRFWADTFNSDKDYVKKICRGIIDRKLPLEWVINSRVDNIDEEMLRLMKKAGCKGVGFGVESGVQKILNNIKKGTTLEDTEEAFKLCKKVDLSSFAFIIFGLPGETELTIKETMKFVNKLNPDYIDYYPAVPYPGTELYNIAKKNNWLISDDWRRYEFGDCVINTDNLTAEMVMNYRKSAYIRFYLTSLKPLKYILSIKSFRDIKRLFKMGINFILWSILGKA